MFEIFRQELHLDFCSHLEAEYAVSHWHYSRSLPPPPITRIGVWEHGSFIGAVIFSGGANKNLLVPYRINQCQGVELSRVALSGHDAPVSKIVAIAIRLLRSAKPELRLIVSFADPNKGHHGGIYQAMSWVFVGTSSRDKQYIGPDGKLWHSRMVKKQGFTTVYGKTRTTFKPDECRRIDLAGKYRYLLPLDEDMRDMVELLRKPFPKRIKQATAERHSASGGAAPTNPLH